MPRKEGMSRDSNVNSEMLVIYQRMSKCKESVGLHSKITVSDELDKNGFLECC